jgi:uncharacterized protein YecT (DUF1311 family)
MKAAPKQIRMMKITVTCVAAFLLAGTSASYSQSGYIPGQPSFDCTKARSTVAIILCNEPEAAAADWDVNSASWALYFSVNESGRQTVDADQQAWAAREWGRRLDEARTKGPQYAAQVGLKWSLSEKQNPLPMASTRNDEVVALVTCFQPCALGDGVMHRGRAPLFALLNHPRDLA